MNTKQFLKAYGKVHGIQVFPKHTIHNDIANLIDKVNGLTTSMVRSQCY